MVLVIRQVEIGDESEEVESVSEEAIQNRYRASVPIRDRN